MYKLNNHLQISEFINYERIIDYFNNFELEIIDNNFQNIYLNPYNYDYCENISVGLSQLGISSEQFSNFCWISESKKIGFCLSENWLPYAWSIMNNKNYHSSNIIHFDAHTDLMSPFVYSNNNNFFSIISGNHFSFSNPYSILESIINGTITIGSQLSCILFSFQQCNIIHISHNKIEQRFSIKRGYYTDHFWKNNIRRLNLSFTNYNPIFDCYSSINNSKYITKYLQDTECTILHIDMDYFNNRFNGTTDWQINNNNFDPPLEIQKQLIHSVCSNINCVTKDKTIDYILIGISPSFFPSQFWYNCLYELLLNLKSSLPFIIELEEALKSKNWDHCYHTNFNK